MQQAITATLGLDVGDRKSHYLALDQVTGEILAEGSVQTTRKGIGDLLEDLPPVRVVTEAGGHSPWIDELIRESGHESVVANPNRVVAITRAHRKSDRVDAMMLARLGRVDVELLCPVKHRSMDAQTSRAALKSREALVRARSKLVNACRGTVKQFGDRLPKCGTKVFHKAAREAVPDRLRAVIEPMLAAIEAISYQIAGMDAAVRYACENVYPETKRLTQVDGVGNLTALAFVLTIDDETRFAKSRDIGPYLGLVPKRSQSGDVDKQLRITKAGDHLMRTLLVQCAHRIVGVHGKDSRLRRWAHARLDEGGKSMKKRTIIAVARKLAVMLHQLWRSGEAYEPLRGC